MSVNAKSCAVSIEMLSLVAPLYGKVRYSMKQYELFAAMIKDSETNLSFPFHSSIGKNLLPMLIEKSFAPSEFHNFPLKYDHDQIHSSKRIKASVALYPSSCALMDLTTTNFASDIFCTVQLCNDTRTLKPLTQLENCKHRYYRGNAC